MASVWVALAAYRLQWSYRLASSTQGYSNYSDCVANAQRNGMTCIPA